MGISEEKPRTCSKSHGVKPNEHSEVSREKSSTNSRDHAVQPTVLSTISEKRLSTDSRRLPGQPTIRSGLSQEKSSTKKSSTNFKSYAIQPTIRSELCKENLSTNSKNHAEQLAVRPRISTTNPLPTSESYSVQSSVRSSRSKSRENRVDTNVQLLPVTGRGRGVITQLTKGYATQPSRTAGPAPGLSEQGGASSAQGEMTHIPPTVTFTPGSDPREMDSPLQRMRDRGEATPLTDIGSRPVQAPTGPRELQLIAFKPKNHPRRCRHFYHWGLLLLHGVGIGGGIGGGIGDLYHSVRGKREPGDLPPEGQAGCMGCIPGCRRTCRGCVTGSSEPGDGYQIRWNYNSDASQNQIVDKRVTVLKDVNAEDLHRICRLVNENFPYSLTVHNCQKFSVRVLRQMVFEGILTLEQFDVVRSAMYEAATATWGAIRGSMEDLRLVP